MGGSYDGFTALAAAVGNPNVTMVIADDTAHELAGYIRMGGQVEMLHTIGLLYFLQNHAFPNDTGLAQICNTLDLGGLDNTWLGASHPFWQTFIDTPDPNGGFFDARTLAVDQICAPVLVIKSIEIHWNSPLDIWSALMNGCPDSRDDHHLIVTPDPHHHHLEQVFGPSTEVAAFILDFIDRWLGAQPLDLSPVAAVQYSAGPGDPYHGAPAWPAHTSTRTFELGAVSGTTGPLAETPALAAADTLAIDPATDDPCDAAYPALYYVSPPLAAPLYMVGVPRVDVRARIDTPDAYFTAVLHAYEPSAGLTYVCEGGVRARYRHGAPTPVTPGETPDLTIDLWGRAYEFPTGSQIVLELTGSRCQWSENPNTGEPIDAQTSRLPVTYTILYGAPRPTRLVLPVVE